MQRLLRALASVFACCFAACSAYADVSLSSTGMAHGTQSAVEFAKFQAMVKGFNASGERFRMDASCPSACTMFLGIRNVCIAPGSTIAVHAGGIIATGVPNPRVTAVMQSYYKPALRKYIVSNHLMDTFDFHTVSGEELIKRFGYPACP